MNEYKELVRSIQEQITSLKEEILSPSPMVYTNATLSKMFGVCPYTLQKWRQSGKIGYSQIGSVIIYSQEDVAKFLKDNHFEAVRS